MDPWAAAQANIAVKYDPQQAALDRQLALSQKNTASNEQSIQGFGNAGRGIIDQSFNTLYGLLGAQKTDTQNALNQQLGLQNQGYDQAIANLQGYQNSSRDYLAKMAAELGQTGQGLVNQGKNEEMFNQQMGYINAARTNYGSTLGDWIAKMGSLSDIGLSNARASGALAKSGFETELLSMLGKNKLAGTEQETDVINKIADLMNVRQSDLIDMYNQLEAEEWQRQFNQRQLEQEMAYKYAALASSEREGAANRAAAAGDDALDWAKFYENQRQFNEGSAADKAAANLAQSNWEKDYALKANPALSLADRLSYVGSLKELGALPKTRDAKGNLVDDTSQIEALINRGPEYFNDWRAERDRRATSIGPQASSYYDAYGITPRSGSPARKTSTNYAGPSWLHTAARHSLFGAPSVFASLW